MRILFGSPAYVYLDGPGGLIMQILRTKAYLEKLGHQVDLFNQWEEFSPASYDIFHLFFATRDSYDLTRRIKEAGLKVVVSPIIDKVIPELIIRLSNAVIKRLPKLYTNLSLASELCNFADLVVARSTEEVGKITRGFGLSPSKVVIVPNGVETQYYNADPSLFIEKYGIKDFVLAVGLMGNPMKNFYRLIDIVGKLPIQMVFIGPVQNNRYAKQCLEEAKRYANIKILGLVEEQILISAYAAADTFILPSIVEGTGLVALEAGLAGAKVIITKNGGPPYYFNDLVEYIDPLKIKLIREKLLKTIEKPKDNRLKQHIKENFTWDKVTIKLEEAYRELLKQ